MMELRRGNREARDGKIRINWRDASGASFGSVGKLIDVSGSGMCADIDRRIEPNTPVLVESRDARVAGTAVISHCRSKGMGYRVGIHFHNRA
ncbi:MAG: PilZ domain-containing protein [Bryobacteraceae bacterium]|nr:PilZ domain-containing protein [Bryobacteraceae bacterium]